MDNLSSSLYFSALAILAVPLLLLLSLRSREARKDRRPRLPPGPWRLPVIGSLHHLAKTPLVHRTLADLARRWSAPVMYLRLGELDTVVISSPDAAREVTKTHDAAFATRWQSATVRATTAYGTGVVLSPHGEQWRRLRKVCTLELLSTRRVRSFRRVREDEAARLVAGIAAACPATPPGERPVNITARVASLVVDSAMRTIFGGRFERREEFLRCVSQAVEIASRLTLGDLFPSSRLVRAMDRRTVRTAEVRHRRLVELVDSAIEQHREERKAAEGVAGAADDEDLIDVLLRIQKEGEDSDCALDMGDIRALILDLFIAGTGSTSTTIQWAMVELMRNPDVMQKAQAELHSALQDKTQVTEDDLVNFPYLKLVVKETLRMHTPGPLLLPKECQESCKVLGYDVPKGAMVLVNAWAICMDPKYWDEPEDFKPERFAVDTMDIKGDDFRYVPFGAGRRICPGTIFAQLNIELVLATLLFHFDWQLPSGVIPSEVDMAEEMGATVRPKRDLYLHPTVRVPLHDTGCSRPKSEIC